MAVLNAGKDGLDNLMKFGYVLILVTVGLMIWASSVGAVDQPCVFNSLCTCTNTYGDNFGTVNCQDSPFHSLPISLNTSKVYSLKMDNTGLYEIDAYFFQATGLYHLEISNNPIYYINENAFAGLERTLWELILRYNKLIEVPSKSLRYLLKLRHLDLSGNDISIIDRSSFRGLQNTLEDLILADNAIGDIPIDAFHGLPALKTLDLSSNNLHEITPDVFREQMNSLRTVNFADNLLREIPYQPLSMLKSLRILDLSSNRITGFQIDDENQPLNIKLSLDKLSLEHNEIDVIMPGSFQYFLSVNQTFLDFNPIHIIAANAFQSARIRELYIRHCFLDFIEPTAFSGLESSLQVLDISGNNITTLPERLLSSFDLLGVLNVKDNKVHSIFPQSVGFTSFQSDLYKLDTSGDRNSPANFQDIKKLDKLRTLTVGKLTSNQLSAEDFLGFGVQLESLRIFRAGLKSIKPSAFAYIRGIKRLDLSENFIDSIEKGAFQGIGQSLVSLRIAHGLTSQMTQLPELRDLPSLQELDLSNNRLKSISSIAFYFLKDLEILELNDNQIESLEKGTFQSDIHKKLELIDMEFNNLRIIPSHTFVGLEKLQTIKLRDNRIEKIERRALMNLPHIQHINLKGNKLTSISDEAFQNLPELRYLDLSFNKLMTFDFDILDQVGNLNSLLVNVSHNNIMELTDNTTSFINIRDQGSSIHHSNIKFLDLSNNNISRINPGYFKPAELSLISLNLAYNSLMNTSKDIFGSFVRLQILDLSNNFIDYIVHDTFRLTRKLQVLNLANNELTEIAPETFRNLGDLRIVDLSFNFLRTLPDSLFVGDDLEKLDLSNNHLTKIPVNSLTNVAALKLRELDMSFNNIGSIHNGSELSIKLTSQRLTKLDLSNNRLTRLEDAAFATLPNLAVLDLSNNEDLEIFGRVFIGLEKNLMELSISNISLFQVPDLALPNLRVLKISYNELPAVPTELAANLTSLRSLDLSYNDLSAVPLITHSLPNLRELSLAGNPITALTNTTLSGPPENLEHLDIAHLHLTLIENGILSKFKDLRSLRLSTFPGVSNFNIPTIIEDCENLRTLWIDAPGPKMVKVISKEGVETYQLTQDSASDLRQELNGILPRKLKNLTFSGAGFNRLSEDILDGIMSTSLHLNLHNTTLSGLPPNFFERLGNIRNISITIDSNNKKFNSMPNPNSALYPNHADKVLLTKLNLQFTTFSCDCEVGWIEFWQRRKRQYFCSSQDWSDETPVRSQMDVPNNCDDAHQDDDLRSAQCSNKHGENLLEILKSDLECGWSAAASHQQVNVFILIALAISFIASML